MVLTLQIDLVLGRQALLLSLHSSCLVPRLVYTMYTWQDDWNGAIANKLPSVKPVLGNWQSSYRQGARCSSVVRAFAHGAMGRRIDPSWGGPIELFLVPASAPRLV